MDSLAKILVAVDFSPCSADAFRQAARLAARSRAFLAALHVVDVSLYTPIPPDPLLPVGLLVTEARQQWGAFAPGCEAREATTLEIAVGRARDLIFERVRADKPDLLVVGAHSDLDAHRPIGGNAAACVQHAGTKVLVVREGQVGPFKSVVACVDFSDTSRLALEQAIRMAALDGASLHILHVYTDPWRGRSEPTPKDIDLPSFRDAHRRAVEERLRKFCEPLAHELGALRAEFHVMLSSSHGEGIIAFAQRHGCDLVVLGTRAKWNIHDFLWGSTAERVVRECPSCVLALKPPGFVQGHHLAASVPR